ncbi:MlaD family protein [Nocardioides cavernaquae]|uniref:MCE family protein n=1 Tax=Nocardioides cavernaquae TaxID=2321396 RepID=A0A3A5H8H5_9ACTN|nr:MlaD family protein [Nocardioides cavernaquae]RJS46732.1 MCE family protein [Nocardioides cavernaquae]
MTTRWLAAVVTAAVVTLSGYVFAQGPGEGDEEDVELVAVFTDASPLVAGNVVKASGVDVGTITDVALRNGKAEVTMQVDPRVLPLHEDATATITTQDLLGERFVLLKRGTPDAPAMGSPMTIPVENTKRVVDLQDVLDSVDTPTSVALAALLTDTGEGLRGEGKQADKAIAALAPAMRQAKDLTAILDDQNALLTRLIDNAQPVASALASNRGAQLNQLVDSATQSLEVVASERTALRTALERLPQTITSSRAALAQLAGAAEPARRTLAALRPVTDDLEDISGELKRFSDAADPALASLPPVLRRADKLLAQAAPVVKALRPAARDLVPTSAAAAQLTTESLSGKSLTDLLEFVKGWSMATSDYDAISHYFKAMVPLSPNSLGDDAAALVPILPDDLLHGLPMPTAPQLPNDGEPGSSVSLPIPGGDDSLSSTGLSQQQESSLVEQLIGGLL